jgi:P-type Ca2+ transporter type 2C
MMAVYRWATRRHGEGLTAQTVAFTASSLAEILYALVCGSPLVRSPDRALPRPNGLLLSTVGGTAAVQALTLFLPPLRRLLHLTPLDRRDWTTVLAGAVLPVALAASRRQSPVPDASHHTPVAS